MGTDVHVAYFPEGTLAWSVRDDEIIWQACPVYNNLPYILQESFQSMFNEYVDFSLI